MKGQEHLTSHLVHYLHEMNRNGHVPKGFGYVHRKHAINEIDGSEIRITDQHAKAMAASLDKAKYVNKLILRNTGLTDEQGIAIIRAMDRTLIRHLDVSYNPQLGRRFYEELVQVLSDPASHIERLEIEGNRVGDRVLHDLVEALLLTKNIQYLNVSRCNIEDAGARDLALLIQECPKLRLLFMHDNRILGFGGNDVAEAVGQSKSLQVFDISWNAICSTGLTKKKEEMTEEEKKKQDEEKEAGKKKKKKAPKAGVQFGEGTKPAAKGFAELFARGFGEAWAEAFASNKSLLHVDMSHNHLEQTDVEIIAEGLRDNQQILGIHFAGNDGDIDTQGFVKPGKALSAAHDTIFTRLPMHEDISMGLIRNSKALELAAHSNCWICEGWTEQRFTYEPGRSDDNPNHDEFKPIKLHLDIDNFEGDLMMKADATSQVYEVHRMLPPGNHRYFFSVDGQPSIAKEQKRTEHSKSKQRDKKLMLDMSKLQIPTFDDGGSPKKGTTPKDSKKKTPKGVREKEAAPEKEPDPDYYELDLPEVNYIENIAQTKTIHSKDQLAEAKVKRAELSYNPIGKIDRHVESMSCVPRPGPKGLGNRSKVRTPWDFSLSVFASYKPDNAKLLNNCFETDWARTKVDKIVKNEEERE